MQHAACLTALSLSKKKIEWNARPSVRHGQTLTNVGQTSTNFGHKFRTGINTFRRDINHFSQHCLNTDSFFQLFCVSTQILPDAGSVTVQRQVQLTAIHRTKP